MEYEQMEMDVRLDSERDLKENISTVVKFLYDQRNREVNVSKVRNKHEGYGIAAEAFAKIAGKEKIVKTTMNMYLGGLQVDGEDCVQTVSSLYNSVVDMACDTISMAADLHRILNDMYYDVDSRTPLEKAIDEAKANNASDNDGFEEAPMEEEPADEAEELEDEEDEEEDEE